ncbi:sugar phosphate isomerase/epimerase [Microlunatus panaciterrae]|uniref:Sugar phosphate isomerase/epimerase n=1 Tax=Microlunatus panaciterrae TaxID=400768 RepID=A0ABS2RIG1_9ACTN|nr:sugar phosphate isomerase/epimerase family protein [Microlunatus panaciterrae]MBM7798322.1 sugar phosphate isomerase/epimerase [Microlunatus panaciterrae]
MYSNLSLGALGLTADFPTALELAAKHGFGGLDPDVGYLRSLGGTTEVQRVAAEVADRGLRWGMAGLPVNFTATAEEFSTQLAALPDHIELLVAAGVRSVGTWIRPMDEDLPYRRNWLRHAGRLALVAEILAGAGLRLGLEYIGPKTFWSTERFPFIHSLAEARELIAETGADNIGLILDTYHWYTAGESVADLRSLSVSDIVAVDINDAPADRERDSQQDLDRRLPGTTGVIDLQGFMSVLRDLDYDGPVKVEPFMKSLAERPIDDVLSEVSGQLDRAID